MLNIMQLSYNNSKSRNFLSIAIAGENLCLRAYL